METFVSKFFEEGLPEEKWEQFEKEFKELHEAALGPEKTRYFPSFHSLAVVLYRKCLSKEAGVSNDVGFREEDRFPIHLVAAFLEKNADLYWVTIIRLIRAYRLSSLFVEEVLFKLQHTKTEKERRYERPWEQDPTYTVEEDCFYRITDHFKNENFLKAIPLCNELLEYAENWDEKSRSSRQGWIERLFWQKNYYGYLHSTVLDEKNPRTVDIIIYELTEDLKRYGLTDSQIRKLDRKELQRAATKVKNAYDSAFKNRPIRVWHKETAEVLPKDSKKFPWNLFSSQKSSTEK